ncbi:MAG TPA: hypothetical protein VN698_10995 [Bacteroidia bacterium]|nr:hypothetical protein [Bacteroidia bacterium]
MKNNFFALLFVVFAFAACKKDVALPIPITTNNTTQTFSLTNDTDYYARFQFMVSQGKDYINTPMYINYQGIADFTPVPSNYSNYYYTAVPVDSVFFDGVLLQYDSSRRYNFPYPRIYNYNNIWRVIGANGIPSFTFNQNPMPTFDYTLVSDTIDRTQGFTMPVHITSSNNAVANIGTSYKYFNPQTTNTIYFSPADLSGGSTPGYSYLSLYAYNINSFKVFGKTMNFRCTYRFSKQVYFK